MRWRLLWSMLTIPLLISCSSLFESDNQEPPKELNEYTQTIVIKTLWAKDVGIGSGGQTLRLVPIFANGRLFVADRAGLVQAINANDGAVIWQIDTTLPITSGPGLIGEKLLLGSKKAEVIALSAVNGQELWKAKVSSEVIAVPRAAANVVVVHTVDGSLHGLNVETGERRWIHSRDEPALTLRGSSSPAIHNETVTVGLTDGKLVNLALATGEPRWEIVISKTHGRSELERIADIDSDPIIDDGIIYAANYQGELAAIDQANGNILWHRQMSIYNNIAADDRYLYVTDASSKVWALDRQKNGTALWQQDELLNRRLTAPAVLGRYVLVGDLEGYVHWLAADTGAQQARIKVDSEPISSAPLVVNAVAYIYADDGSLMAMTIGP